MPPKKNNKTAHVLNLLTTNEDSQQNLEPEKPLEQQQSVQQVQDITTQEKTQPAISIQNAVDDPISDILREELEKTLDNEIRETATVGDTLLPLRDNADKKESRDTMTDELNNTSITGEPEDFVTVNVVEDIVKSRAKDFIGKMGGCTCHRCVNDVIALALNELPPKYTVTHKGMLFTKIASYENQYSVDISKALTKACMMVLESPRH